MTKAKDAQVREVSRLEHVLQKRQSEVDKLVERIRQAKKKLIDDSPPVKSDRHGSGKRKKAS